MRLIMMVGLPASGKSSIAKDLAKGRDNVVIHSSDELRKELFGDENLQDKNVVLFSELHKRINEDLKNGKDVIYDATNVSRKRRVAFLNQLPRGVEIDKIVLYVATPYEEVLNRNANRDRVVPEDVIAKMYKTLQIPIKSEGWDKIVYDYTDDIIETDLPKQFTDMIRIGVLLGREKEYVMEFLSTYFEDFFKIYDLPQDSKWHSFSVSRHTYHVYKYIMNNYEGKDDLDKELMLWTALLHDIGKAFAKSFVNYKGEKTKYANFIGHEFIGSQIAVNFLKIMNFEDKFIEEVATLIQFHMYLLNEQANKDKLKNLVGEEMFEKLEILREADTYAH